MSKYIIYRDLITSRVKSHYYGNMNPYKYRNLSRLAVVQVPFLFDHPYLIYKNMFKHHSIWKFMDAGTIQLIYHTSVFTYMYI